MVIAKPDINPTNPTSGSQQRAQYRRVNWATKGPKGPRHFKRNALVQWDIFGTYEPRGFASNMPQMPQGQTRKGATRGSQSQRFHDAFKEKHYGNGTSMGHMGHEFYHDRKGTKWGQ